MDDGYVIRNDLAKLKDIQKKIREIVREIGLELNPKKEKIIPLKHHKFIFLKTHF